MAKESPQGRGERRENRKWYGPLPAILFSCALCVPAVSLLSPTALHAQAEFTDPVLQGELWMPFAAIVPGELERRVPDQEKLDALLEEMQTVFSGMIYGWSFTYRPVDPSRGVPEFLDVAPLGRIGGPSANPGLNRATAYHTRIDDKAGTLNVAFRYFMEPFEVTRRAAWASFNLDQAAGTGKAKVADRLESRLDALRQAVKEAVRNLLRPRYYNRPQEIRGEALLREVPRYSLQSGVYFCSAKFQLRILKVREYPLY